jgi:hypothetical protein
MVPVFTCCSLDEGGTRLCPCSLAVTTPQHFATAFPSERSHLREVPHPHFEDKNAPLPAPIRQVQAGVH